MTAIRYARYKTLVHAINRNSDYGIPVTVYAPSRAEARKRAIAIGWGGDERDAQVTVRRVDDTDPGLGGEAGPGEITSTPLERCGDCGHPWDEHLRDLGVEGYVPQGCTWPSCRCTEPRAVGR